MIRIQFSKVTEKIVQVQLSSQDHKGGWVSNGVLFFSPEEAAYFLAMIKTANEVKIEKK